MSNEELLQGMHNHINMLTQRIMSTEIALDTCIAMLSEKDEAFMAAFSERYQKRSEEVNAQIKANVEKAKQEKEEKEPESLIVTP